VRIERGDHAAYRLLHERLVVDLIDVLALDALVDLGEEPRLFQGSVAGALALSSARCSALTSPAMAPEKPKTAPRRERSACATHRHFLQTPPEERWKYYSLPQPVNEIL